MTEITVKDKAPYAVNLLGNIASKNLGLSSVKLPIVNVTAIDI
jgi:hypothetical protein